MEWIKTVIHWASYTYYLYVFGYASLFKAFQKASMMKSMESLGFNKSWTIIIGYCELIGVLLLVTGLYKPKMKTMGILLLFPMAMAAFTTHMAHHEFKHFFNSLLMCVLAAVLLCTDKTFKIIL